MKKEKKLNKKLVGAEGFEKYYAKLFGERWKNLRTALLKPVNYFELSENLQQSYFLDKASFFAAKQMPILNEGLCLDMCAAPGGKSLVLITQVLQACSQLQANDPSLARQRRLKKVLREHLDDEYFLRVKFSTYDGSRMCRKKILYERILVDAPCSSERHVLTSEKHLAQWTETRIKNLAIRQWSLLSSAFLMLKEEGFLLYSTCALSDAENDFVIDRLLAKYKNAECIKIPAFEKAETTKHGLIFLPDTSGYGPLYFALVKKVPNTNN
ncbi:MAG: SAM-dependent methyltransferase [Treponemataceae bacterium]